MRLPRKLSVNTPEAETLNDIIDYLRSLTPQSSGTVRVTHGPAGVVVEALPKSKPGGSGGPSMFLLVSDGGDYYNCQATTDGVTGSGPYVKVAKTQDLRCILSTSTPAGGAWPGNPSARTIRGTAYTYAYVAQNATTADGVNVTEYWRTVSQGGTVQATGKVAPYLAVGDIIFADPFSFTAPATLAGVQWLARADGRAWADDQ